MDGGIWRNIFLEENNAQSDIQESPKSHKVNMELILLSRIFRALYDIYLLMRLAWIVTSTDVLVEWFWGVRVESVSSSRGCQNQATCYSSLYTD